MSRPSKSIMVFLKVAVIFFFVTNIQTGSLFAEQNRSSEPPAMKLTVEPFVLFLFPTGVGLVEQDRILIESMLEKTVKSYTSLNLAKQMELQPATQSEVKKKKNACLTEKECIETIKKDRDLSYILSTHVTRKDIGWDIQLTLINTKIMQTLGKASVAVRVKENLGKNAVKLLTELLDSNNLKVKSPEKNSNEYEKAAKLLSEKSGIAKALKNASTKNVAVVIDSPHCEKCDQAIKGWQNFSKHRKKMKTNLISVTPVPPGASCAPPAWEYDTHVCLDVSDSDYIWFNCLLSKAFVWNWQGKLIANQVNATKTKNIIQVNSTKPPKLLVESPLYEKKGKLKAIGGKRGAKFNKLILKRAKANKKIKVLAGRMAKKESAKIKKIAKRKAKKHGIKKGMTYNDYKACPADFPLPQTLILKVKSTRSTKNQRLWLDLVAPVSHCIIAEAEADMPSGKEKAVTAKLTDKILSSLISQPEIPKIAPEKPKYGVIKMFLHGNKDPLTTPSGKPPK